jgi:short-subunit dehydrogenase
MAHGLGSVAGSAAVVTGAASGIGRATAELLAAKGAAVALLDIDEVGLMRVAEELRRHAAKVVSHKTDVANEPEVRAFAAFVEQSLGPVELVVNCAGIVVYGDFLATPAEDFAHVVAVNLEGAANVCRAFVPGMVERRRGQIVNVASAAAFTTPAGLAAYGATKHALRGLSDGLREELAEHGVGVTVVCPGFADTKIAENARLRGAADIEVERQRLSAFLRRRGLSPERVAARIVRAAERGDSLVPVGLEAHLLYALSRFAPARVPALFALAKNLAERSAKKR